MFQKLKSKKGIFLSLVAYPILILAVAYAANAFVSSINGNNLAKINLKNIQAQYDAYKGIEYAALEIRDQSATPFMTHTVNTNSNDLTAQTVPTPHYGGAIDVASGAYTLTFGTNDKVEVKTYMYNNEIFILARGTSGNKQRLFSHKIAGTSLYNYFSFFPGNASFGWQTLDSQGAKIHANGDMAFQAATRILNTKELTSEGKMYWVYSQFLKSGEENGNSYGFVARYPYWTPNDYNFTTPPSPPDNNGDGVPDNNVGNYINKPDGHYAGDRYGLIVYDIPSGKYRSWKDTTHLADTMKPIYPWPGDGSGWQSQTDGSGNPLWDPDSVNRNYVYKQARINCATDAARPCATHLTNNINYDNGSNNSINGVFIPNDLGGDFYPVPKYMNHNGAADETTNINLTDSNITQASRAAWDNFISLFPKNEVNQTTITGLAGVVKAGLSRGASHITPPKIDIAALKSRAATSGQGMIIENDSVNDPVHPVKITVNGASGQTVRLAEDGGLDSSVGCDVSHPVFIQKTFINGKSTKQNKAVQVNIANMLYCESVQPGKWTPNSGLLYSTYGTGLALDKAEQLPNKGLTSIVDGNIYLQGHYNYNASGAADWTWQPSAAIVSNFTYALSKDFDYPTTVPYHYRHPEYPYAGTYTYNGSTYTIPAGTNNPNFVTGFNWWAIHKNDMMHRVDCPDCAGETPGAIVNSTLTGDNIPSYIYDISLVGAWGSQVQYLEMWGYPSVDGDLNTPPSGWRTNKAVVIGAAIQLSNEFPTHVPFDWNDFRQCSAPDPNHTGSYPCRNSPGATWDLLGYGSNALRKYQTQYLTSPTRPPGDYTGYFKSILVELTNTPANWQQHSPVFRTAAVTTP